MPAEYIDIDALIDQSRPLGRKRKRVSVACRPCRTRKSRCDGANPCSTCQEMEVHCQYDMPCTRQAAPAAREAIVDTRKDQITVLEQRFQAIERRLESLEETRSHSNSFTPHALKDGLHELTQQSKVTHTGSSSSEQGTPPAIPVPGMPRLSDQPDTVDGMGSVALRDGAEEEEYFGNSSNVAFLRSIVQATVHSAGFGPKTLLEPDHVRPEYFGNDCSDSFLVWPSGTDPPVNSSRRTTIEPFALPPEDAVNSMLQLYFNTVNLMIPCVHEDSFRQTLFQMKTEGPESMRRSWLGVLNMMFALSTNVMTTTTPTHDRAAQSNTFYERAMELVSSGILGRPSVEMVQLFLLMEIYLEGTPASSLAWTFHSLAVKGSYQLGLHLTGSMRVSHVERECRRRLWYWCITNDRLLSVGYGRPPLIPLSHVETEPCSHVAFSNVADEIIASSSTYFDAIISITHIMGDAIDRLYGQNLGSVASVYMSETLSQVSDLLSQLDQWQEKLPGHLKTISSSEDMLENSSASVETTRLRVLLSLRYLGARILVLRTILSHFFPPSGRKTPNEYLSEWLLDSSFPLIADLARACIQVFQISKDLLTASMNNQNLLGAWWFSCYYTFNASLAILGVLLIKRNPLYSMRLPSSSIENLRSSLDTAMKILRGLDSGNKTIMRCRDILARLVTTIDSGANATELASPASLWSPPSAWSWQLMDPSLFSSEASLSLAPAIPSDTASLFLPVDFKVDDRMN